MKPETLAKFFSDKAQQINNEHQAAIGLAVKTLQHALQAGRLLMEVKAKLAHGEWEPWCEKNLQLTSRTASTYMRLARHEKEIKEAKRENPQLTIDDAVKLLAAPAAPDSESPVAPFDGEVTDAPADLNPPSGFRVIGRIQNRVARIERHREPGYVFVTVFDVHSEEDIEANGTKRGIHESAIRLALTTCDFDADDATWTQEPDAAKPTFYNKWLYTSQQDYLQNGFMKAG